MKSIISGLSKPAKKKNDTNPLISGISGASIGMLSTIITSPIEVIKTRMQSQRPSMDPQKGLVEIFRESYSERGFSDYFVGLSPTIMALLSFWGTNSALYEYGKQRISRRIESKYAVHLISAISSGAVSELVSSPFWVAKVRMQAQSGYGSEKIYTTTSQTLARIYQEEGLKALFSGLGASLIGLSGIAVYYPTYEKLKSVFRSRIKYKKALMKKNKNNLGVNFKKAEQDEEEEYEEEVKLGLLHLFIASSLAKGISSVVDYPSQVVRTQVQSNTSNKKKKYFDVVKEIYSKSGISGLYAGFGTNLIKVIPSTAISFTAYEFLTNYLTVAFNALKIN
ncbi:nicotinamide adenine dinucleotide transporter 1-related [Anaeramoeba flamelloides]|uniref:Nicotinamide adenine dinucleotide transporter 1-related n=1 Tax=Anaeramoeba flamelloides TaxID=1746091 RepID=A0ABQ8Y1S0_9EUKA|nr:nicotinamide adenine dinucleotide transporter 1-related [Anaeramoeba flamelloides]